MAPVCNPSTWAGGSEAQGSLPSSSKFEAGLGYLKLQLKYVYRGSGSGACQQPGSPSHTFRRFCPPKARHRSLDPLCTPAFGLHISLPLEKNNLEEDMCTWLMVSEVLRLLGSVISGAHNGTAPWCARANLLTSLQPGKEARMGGRRADLLQGHLPCSFTQEDVSPNSSGSYELIDGLLH